MNMKDLLNRAQFSFHTKPTVSKLDHVTYSFSFGQSFIHSDNQSVSQLLSHSVDQSVTRSASQLDIHLLRYSVDQSVSYPPASI